MGTNCASLFVDLFLFCYERDFMMPLSDDRQAVIIEDCVYNYLPVLLRLWIICVIYVLWRLFIAVLWPPAGKG